MSIFSDNLKMLREDTDITQKEIASELNVGLTTYASYEQGRSEPSLDMLVQIANYWEVSIDELLGRESYTNDKFSKFKLDKILNQKVERYMEDFIKDRKQTIIEEIMSEFNE